MDRKASARWTGDLKAGNGTVRLGSGAFEGSYSFSTRFEDTPGANPEELLGAAHASCYSMALSSALSKAGFPPRTVFTEAVVHLGKVGDAMKITAIDLDTRATASGISPDEFGRIAEEVKSGCIVSQALASVPMTLRATLET